MFSLLPWKTCESIYQLTGAGLAQAGITCLLADLDNTLCAYGQPEPSQALCRWKMELEGAGVVLFLLSNSRKPSRPKRFAQALGISHIGHAGKPKPAAFHQAMEQCGVSPQQCAMVGDQIFTDILGANLAGVRSILVRPIQLAGNPGRYLRYGAELPMRVLAARRRWPVETERM